MDHAWGENIEFTKNLTYLGNVVHDSGLPEQEFSRLQAVQQVLFIVNEYLEMQQPVQND